MASQLKAVPLGNAMPAPRPTVPTADGSTLGTAAMSSSLPKKPSAEMPSSSSSLAPLSKTDSKSQLARPSGAEPASSSTTGAAKASLLQQSSSPSGPSQSSRPPIGEILGNATEGGLWNLAKIHLPIIRAIGQGSAEEAAASLALKGGETDVAPRQPRVSVKDVFFDTSPFLERASPVPNTVFIRYREQVDNHAIAEVTRVEKEDLLRLKDHNTNMWMVRGRELGRERQERKEHSRQVQQLLQERNESNVRAMRDQEAIWQAERERRQEEHELLTRERILLGSALQVKMTQTEEKEQEHHRQQSRQYREEWAQAVSRAREEKLATNKSMVAQVRAMTDQATAEQLASANRKAVAQIRDKAQQLKSEREKRDEEYLERARANRQRAAATRVSARRAMEESQNNRRRAAAKERANNDLVIETKVRVLTSNRREVANVYKQRFASAEAAAEWEASPLNRLHAAASFLVRLKKPAVSTPQTSVRV